MGIHSEITTAPANKAARVSAKAVVRADAEAHLATSTFPSLYKTAVESLRRFKKLDAEREQAANAVEAIVPRDEIRRLINAAHESVSIPSILKVPHQTEFGHIVTIIRIGGDGKEHRQEFGDEFATRAICDRDELLSYYGGDEAAAAPAVEALRQMWAERAAAMNGVEAGLPKEYHEAKQHMEKARERRTKAASAAMQNVLAALTYPITDHEPIRQKADLLWMACLGDAPRALRRPDKAKPSLEPEDLLAAFAGALVRDITSGSTPPSTSKPREDGVTSDIPSCWSQVMAVRPDDPVLADVVRYAIAEGHRFEELSQTVYVSPEMPGWAPALYFEKPNGDLVIVTRRGVQTAYGRHRDRQVLAAAE